jgi:hypothetical protein
MLPRIEIKPCSFCNSLRARGRQETKPSVYLNGTCNECTPVSYEALTDTLKQYFIKFQELETENQTHQQALQTSQTWHERQKQEIIAEWKQKLTNFLNTRKNQINQELNLIREVLHD